MRSRYTAYVLDRFDYIRATWSNLDRPADLNPVAGRRWLGLKLKRIERGLINDDVGTVEFVARYKINGRAYRLHETSRFQRVRGRWIYCGGKEMP